jgi:hypothetical protein
MASNVRDIDVSAISELVRIKREEDVLRDRMTRMDASREKVSAVVFARVRSDYESRSAALEAESRPLKERARLEYAKLKAARGEAERLVEESALEKEELEFRKDLGEYADGDFQPRMAECENRLATRRSELDEIEMLRSQFVAAFRSEHELETPGDHPPVEEPPSAAARGEETLAQPLGRIPAPDLGGPSVSETFVAPLPGATAPLPTSGDSGSTVVLSLPRLVLLTGDEPGEEYPLRPGTTSIGRSPKNHIRLPHSEVSRHHADVTGGAEGFRIIDGGSDNGLFVNGDRVMEHLLADGDVIQIGMQKLVFRA